MARAKFIDNSDFELMLERAGVHTEEVARVALKAGASVIANQMKENLKGILSDKATGQLVAAFGITPMKRDTRMNFNVHLGFDGYQEPGHVPFQLIARSFESGAVMGGRYEVGANGKRKKKKISPDSYWRKPTPFAKPAVEATKQQAYDAMTRVAEKELKKITEGD